MVKKIRIDGKVSPDNPVSYKVVATETITPKRVNSDDSVQAKTAQGFVGSGMDILQTRGEIRLIDLDRPEAATVYVDGQVVDPSNYSASIAGLDSTTLALLASIAIAVYILTTS
jgi:hypothetical protein